MPDDSIGRLQNQIKALNRSLDTELDFQHDLKALRLLRLTLQSIVANSSTQLSQITETLRQINLKVDLNAALFSQSGDFKSFSSGLEHLLLEKEPSEPLFGNGLEALKFCDEKNKALNKDDLPWKKELSDLEIFEPRINIKSGENGIEKTLACLVTQLDSPDGKEKAKAACFIDVSSLVKLEQRLSLACKAYDREVLEIANASGEIEQLEDRLRRKREARGDTDEYEVPRTSERPPEQNYDAVDSNKVLVIDDIAINQKLLAKRLQKLNFEAEFASNGQQGVEKALSGNYALIFMDCDMPIMDGFEATKEIRKAELNTGRHVPIIAMTSYDREDDRERCLSAGMDEYLPKGASANLLQEVMEWCLRRSKIKDDKDLSIADYEEELDMSALRKTYTKEELNEIFEMFLPSTNTLMLCLRMSIDDRDVRSIGHFAYSLKGPFASLGMLMTSKLTARLTDAAEESQWEEANDYYDMLSKNCRSIQAQVEDRASRAQ